MGLFQKVGYVDSNGCIMFIQCCTTLNKKESSCGESLTATLYLKDGMQHIAPMKQEMDEVIN